MCVCLLTLCMSMATDAAGAPLAEQRIRAWVSNFPPNDVNMQRQQLFIYTFRVNAAHVEYKSEIASVFQNLYAKHINTKVLSTFKYRTCSHLNSSCL